MAQGSISRARSGKLLVVSNGHGEDAVGAEIGAALRELAPDIDVPAASIVGLGGAYRRKGLPVVTPVASMPSGGFIGIQRPGAVWQDLRAGLLRLHLRQARTLCRLRVGITLMVGVGDRLMPYTARWIVRRPLIMVDIADSAYLSDRLSDVWTPLDVSLLRRTALWVFTRDAFSAASLAGLGVRARFVGNPMMDSLTFTDEGPVVDSAGSPVVAILPGSRPEAYRNLSILLSAVPLLAARHPYLSFVMAWAESLPLPASKGGVHWPDGWRWVPAGGGTGQAGFLYGSCGAKVTVVASRFGDVLRQATVVMGMAGTANEQAAGLGKPVVTCPGRGPQVTEELCRRQERLLGEAVTVTVPRGEALADAVSAILSDPARMERMGDIGKARMGPAGGSRRIARYAIRAVRLLQRATGDTKTRSTPGKGSHRL
ncbi:lipid-A-disaccharide synthase-related protein [Carboxydochorda subterranea]|uniref:Lipid-A-disaccharide synthase-related protein n=1 Tax=Carboxydichorda subterranea TaxID=3109565 RepID=A0ABZ1BZW0_9FIRM|nr:lipid-A-disaccharide synthase-related protein [Limnochorda sp. L945t]WRP18371.1 lipid-A-disaccharide synthase-related protein [Limnochorda sp. L945t]